MLTVVPLANQKVYFRVTVTSSTNVGRLTGTVRLFVDLVHVFNARVNAQGVANIVAKAGFSAGNHYAIIEYLGDAKYAASVGITDSFSVF